MSSLSPSHPPPAATLGVVGRESHVASEIAPSGPPLEPLPPAKRYPRLEAEVTADVVVVGAGLSGLSTAYRLIAAGKSVVVLEARVVGSGSAARGLGMLSRWVNETYLEVERTAGLGRACQVAASHAAAIAFVRRVAEEEGIECGLAETEACVLAARAAGRAGRQRASRELREELAACLRAGVDGAHIERRRRHAGGGSGAEGSAAGEAAGGSAGAAGSGAKEEGAEEEEVLVVPGAANLQPLRYLQGLAEAVVRRGATLGSEVVAGSILGGPHLPDWAEAYRPSRVFPGAALKYTWELGVYFSTVGMALLKHVVPRSVEDVAGLLAPGRVERALQPGQGKVAQHGLLKKALYRDEDGVLHVRSALCTHLGCCVEWNPLEHTFDCPCHGSSFDACGRCLHAPAVADLEDLGSQVR
ncbi:putative Rieske 2Fe-2S iron-sulfur protein yhfW [Tetrabaena socialis]|uniref:Putative Rieske 2Fe-2S iron-sulfur protein yhfW n=1 Tax=Tetrabaena socialis TaxID=47790 RepID=A0A2J8AK71_9CHLO|nr:putative Rieske 2Fe-2S iron-sulfur protein yhfW [Tetrabaena socialis]|eukprot:PNH12908.1 putative Rieske 2Fe-2S iron-sulfur protein yhfW [Tetrabaena socialis]